MQNNLNFCFSAFGITDDPDLARMARLPSTRPQYSGLAGEKFVKLKLLSV